MIKCIKERSREDRREACQMDRWKRVTWNVWMFFFLFALSPSQHSALRILFTYNRVCGFLSLLFIICPGKADNCLAVISGVINLDDDNRRKTCAVCEAGGTLLQHHMHYSCYTLTSLRTEMYLRARVSGCVSASCVYIYTACIHRHSVDMIHYAIKNPTLYKGSVRIAGIWWCAELPSSSSGLRRKWLGAFSFYPRITNASKAQLPEAPRR